MTQANNSAQSPVLPSEVIHGVYTVPIRVFEDSRGRFMETFRLEWFPHVNWSHLQSNRSESKAGVLRGLHYHLHQVDYWTVPSGLVRVALADLRPSSPTYKATDVFEVGNGTDIGVFIPAGVAHGFVALTDATLVYIVNQYYDNGADENGVAWDDPDLGVDWGIVSPELSPRDLANLRLRDIPRDRLPV